ncbi:MAG TPA: hypothetical protein VF158_02245 [Longimicrobiales bacterium]
MTEAEFGEALASRIRERIGPELEVETKRSLLYALSFDDEGRLRLGLNRDGEPVRGGGTGFEQDLLIFNRSARGDTSIVPRVVIELKFGRMTTHQTIVYSEKARRIRAIYPYVRYGLVPGQLEKVPARTLRLGTEFDFIVAVDEHPTRDQEDHLTAILLEEIDLSRRLADVVRGKTPVRSFRRSLIIE